MHSKMKIIQYNQVYRQSHKSSLLQVEEIIVSHQVNPDSVTTAPKAGNMHTRPTPSYEAADHVCN